MRVGQSLSRLLDPAKPPMFSDEQEQLQALLPEEVWEEGEAQQAQQAKQQQRQGSAAAAGPRQPAARDTGGAAQRCRREREQRRAQRRGGWGDPAEGPLTETDSDDEQGGWGSDASSVSSSGSEGSASSGGLEAYDLEESDEEDPASSKLQVRWQAAGRPGARDCSVHACTHTLSGLRVRSKGGRRRSDGQSAVPTSRLAAAPPRCGAPLPTPQLRDLPKMLLSGAEQDWRGQLRALRHAEYLIRAAPDELEQYAGGGGWLAGCVPGALPAPAPACPCVRDLQCTPQTSPGWLWQPAPRQVAVRPGAAGCWLPMPGMPC